MPVSKQDIAHDRRLIEAGFHSGIAPKRSVEALFKKYKAKPHKER